MNSNPYEKISKIIQVTSESQVNKYLKDKWLLLYVSEKPEKSYKVTQYTLGWSKDLGDPPEDTI